MKANLKPFDLEAVKNGAQVVTRDGRNARFLGEINASPYPLVFAVCTPDNEEIAHQYRRDGRFNNNRPETQLDLFIKPKTVTVTRYLTVFIDERGEFIPGGMYTEEEVAAQMSGDLIKPIKIEIEYEK